MKSARYPSLPPLNSLLAFEAAARHESFSRASQDLFLSASAIAHQVKQLENALGIELFTRHSRGVQLNAKGRDLLTHVQQQLAALQTYTEQIRDNDSQPLQLATLHAIAQLWLQPRLRDYQTTHPNHSIEITAHTNIDTPPPEADIAINFFAEPPVSTEWELLWEEQLILVSAPDYPWKNNKIVLYQDSHWRQDWRIWHQSQQSEENYEITIAHIRQASLYALVLQSVLDGLGVMIASQSLVMEHLLQGTLVPCPYITDRTIRYGGYYLSQTPKQKLNPLSKEFCKWLQNVSATAD